MNRFKDQTGFVLFILVGGALAVYGELKSAPVSGVHPVWILVSLFFGVVFLTLIYRALQGRRLL